MKKNGWDVHHVSDRRSLLRGPAWDAVVAAVVAESEMVAELEAERLLAA